MQHFTCLWLGLEADGTILVEIDKSTWETLQEKSKMHTEDMNYVLAETILQRFLNASYVYDKYAERVKQLDLRREGRTSK